MVILPKAGPACRAGPGTTKRRPKSDKPLPVRRCALMSRTLRSNVTYDENESTSFGTAICASGPARQAGPTFERVCHYNHSHVRQIHIAGDAGGAGGGFRGARND